MILTLLRDDLFRVCSGSDHAEAVSLEAFPSSRIPVAATACVVPFLLDPAAALGHTSPWDMKLQCLELVAAFLLGVPSAVCTLQPPTASMLARFRLPAWSSVHVWLLRLRTGSNLQGPLPPQPYTSMIYLPLPPCSLPSLLLLPRPRTSPSPIHPSIHPHPPRSPPPLLRVSIVDLQFLVMVGLLGGGCRVSC